MVHDKFQEHGSFDLDILLIDLLHGDHHDHVTKIIFEEIRVYVSSSREGFT